MYLHFLRKQCDCWITDISEETTAEESLILQQMLSGDVHPYGNVTALLQTQGCGLKVPLLLLRYGANPNHGCGLPYGESILHRAARQGDLPLVRLLLAAGADPDAANNSNQTVQDVAQENCKPYIRFASTQRGIDFKSGTLEDAMALFITNQTVVLTIQISLDKTIDADEALVSLTNMAGEELEPLKVKLEVTPGQMKAAIAEQVMIPVNDLVLVLATGNPLETSSADTVKELLNHAGEHSLVQSGAQVHVKKAKG
jgi:hypothetical protein